ncbi:SDR family oxidoreductase [Sporomusa sphaeroides]|jgi:NAD(P)-dependent dehydrogenase (short-subunit alcohol dehydrogenase family)|uniref:SDR family oxidoreductase n=2 Tax=Sporomusa TaxID=2375 RepID=UPI002C588FD4|nr:SDR family oxidoreductase [Sporomusa sphaeroides]HML31652.1 SDR family oxidoreductase [Sporomusa sphaeroides]
MYPKYSYLGMEEQCEAVPVTFPPQHQNRQPGMEYLLHPRPISENPNSLGSGKLRGKVAIITGGDSGIGRAAAYAFAKEGASIAIAYLDEHRDAEETKGRIHEIGQDCILLPGDLRNERQSYIVVEETMETFGRLDILVNNHGVQFPQMSILDISAEQLDATFRTNIFAFFYMIKAALPHMCPYASIINTTSVTAYQGEKYLIDYSATKGAIVSLTRSLSLSLTPRHIRVNAVAPGPIWTPLNPSSFPAEYIKTFGANTPMKRAGQPFEVAPAYVYLASDDSRYVSGQVLHVNGGTITES